VLATQVCLFSSESSNTTHACIWYAVLYIYDIKVLTDKNWKNVIKNPTKNYPNTEKIHQLESHYIKYRKSFTSQLFVCVATYLIGCQAHII